MLSASALARTDGAGSGRGTRARRAVHSCAPRRWIPLACVCAVIVGAISAAPSMAAVGKTASPLLACLEPVARKFHVRIVDASGTTTDIACSPPAEGASIEQTLDDLLHPNGLDWRRLADGTLQIVAAQTPPALKLPALAIEGDPVPDVPRPDYPVATPLIEHATAQTTLDRRWLDTAPLLGFNQLGTYAPNVYGSGRSIAIRGAERDTDYFPALTVTFDGIELGYRMLDDELVPLDDVTELNLARGPRTFEAAGGSQAGEISLKTAPPAVEPVSSVAVGVGDAGARNGEVAWSGPLGASGVGASVALDEHELPGFVRQVSVPAANVALRRNRFGRAKLRYAADTPFSAEVDALALSGDSSDRQVVAPTPPRGQPPPPFDPFQRDSYSLYPAVARTHARGAAGFARYEAQSGWTADAHFALTSITRDAHAFPGHAHWTDRELRRRDGVVVSDRPADDWTVVASLERDHVDTTFYTPVAPFELIYSFLGTTTDSASLWAEHTWGGGSWNAGLGLRWLHERTSQFPSGRNTYDYRLPVPLAAIEWHPWAQHTFALSYGAGFRSGGQINPFVAGSTFVPERSQNVELAWRAHWLEGTLNTTCSAFDGRTRDRFTYRLEPSGAAILTDVRVRGVELEGDDELSPRWRVRAGIGVLSSHFSSVNYRFGDPTSEAPPQTATLGVRYGLEHGIYGAADAYRAAAAEYDIASVAVGRLPAYDVVAFRIGYRSTHWDTALVASNAFDAQYLQRIQFSVASQMGYRLGDPRRVELRVKASW